MKRLPFLLIAPVLAACGSPTDPRGPGAAAPQPPVASESLERAPAATAPLPSPSPDEVAAAPLRAAVDEPAAPEPARPAPVEPPPPAPAEAPQRELVRAIEADPDPGARRAAIDRYVADPDADPEPVLRALFSDRDPVVRRWAALALERSAEPALRDSLQQAAAGEPDAAVRSIIERAIRACES